MSCEDVEPMTPKERAGDLLEGGMLFGDADAICAEIADAITAAVAEERDAWHARFVDTTTHRMSPNPCALIGHVIPACTCGAHARLAMVHAEIAAALRARL